MTRLVEALTGHDAPEPDLAFPRKEYDRRLEAVRARMRAEGLELMLVSGAPNQCYLAGYETLMPTCYAVLAVPLEGEPMFHLPEEDVPCVLVTGWVRDIVVFDWAQPLDPAGQLANALREREHGGRVTGVEMARSETYAYGAMDAHTYVRLTELLPDAELRDATNLVQEVRLRKSPAELEHMRRAGELSMAGIAASLDALTPGTTDSSLAAAAYAAMVAGGSEVMSIDPIVLGGRRGAWAAPHHTFGGVVLEPGDAVYLEYSGCHRRYNAPAMRSACLGEPSADARELADACLETVDLLVGAIAPGRTGDDVARDARPALAGLGDDAHFHGGYGYAVGLGFPPTWTEAPVYLAEGGERELEPGMTFHLPIWLWKPGRVAVGFSETVVVTDSGCALVTPGTDRELQVR